MSRTKVRAHTRGVDPARLSARKAAIRAWLDSKPARDAETQHKARQEREQPAPWCAEED